MNKREGAIISAYTGFLCGSFSAFHEYAEQIMKHPIWTHQFGDKEMAAKIKEASKADFLKLCEDICEEATECKKN